jgi:hypothetical protein
MSDMPCLETESPIKKPGPVSGHFPGILSGVREQKAGSTLWRQARQCVGNSLALARFDCHPALICGRIGALQSFIASMQPSSLSSVIEGDGGRDEQPNTGQE